MGKGRRTRIIKEKEYELLITERHAMQAWSQIFEELHVAASAGALTSFMNVMNGRRGICCKARSAVHQCCFSTGGARILRDRRERSKWACEHNWNAWMWSYRPMFLNRWCAYLKYMSIQLKCRNVRATDQCFSTIGTLPSGVREISLVVTWAWLKCLNFCYKFQLINIFQIIFGAKRCTSRRSLKCARVCVEKLKLACVLVT
jgi:hypothetical protein